MSQTPDSQRHAWVLGLLEAYEGRLVRYAARMLGNEDSARDVVQYTFLRLCERPTEQMRERAPQWLFTVCRNRAVDVLRKERRNVQWEENAAWIASHRESDPAAAAEQHDLFARLNELVAELPAQQREAVDLWAEGFSYREIASITGQGEGKLRVLVHRALKRLRGDPATQRMLGSCEGANPSQSAPASGKVGT